MLILKKLAMRRFNILFIILSVIGLLTDLRIQAQPCSWSGAGTWYFYNAPATIPCGSFSVPQSVGSGTYNYFYAYAGVSYTISTCGSSFDTQLSIYDANPAWTYRAGNDDNGPDCGGLQASVTWTATYTGDHLAVVNRYNCQQHDFTGTSAILKIRKDTSPCTTQTSSTWTGSSNSDWFNVCNWTNCVPGTITNAIVPVVATNPIVNTSPAYVNTITVSPGANVTVNAPATLTSTQ